VTDLAEPLPGVAPAPRAIPVRGYALYLVAAFLFALNGTVAKTVMANGVDVWRLSQLRTTGAFVVLLAFVAATSPRALRVRRGELPLLVLYGVFGVAATQALYFLSIQRLPIGVSLLIEFTAPLVIALWFHFVLHHRARPAVWIGLVMAVAGLAVVAQVWDGFTLDPLGFAAAVGAMLALVVYFLSADAQVNGPYRRDPVSLTMWGMGAAALFWAILQPWWAYPWSTLGGSALAEGTGAVAWPIPLLVGYVVVLGTVVPFSLVVLSMQHLRASQASVVGMTEPVIATGIAWVVLGEVLSPAQLAGAVIVLAGILLAELNR
jgi:drug/metabolite transporter (DMT)-like permease